MFSHEGARRGKEFAVSSFAHQIAKGEKNGNCVVKRWCEMFELKLSGIQNKLLNLSHEKNTSFPFLCYL